ncbi:MAG: glycosyltransferase family 2 protein [Gammaproteobacteria bacterium]|nr:glycosyltransferase family 2 protein [Gammaproteobacteria bacterium]
MDHDTSSITLSVIIPCFNESDNLVALVAEVAQALAATRFEIIVVDDCSTDDTAARLQRLKLDCPNGLRVVRHQINSGQSAALCTGCDVARGHWIATLDGDGQNDPADLPHLLKTATELAATHAHFIVCGHRWQRRDTWLRRFSSRVANGVRSKVLRDATPDTGCGLKIFPRQTFLELPRFNHMHRFLPALVQRTGGVSKSLPVNHRPRVHGVSKYGVGNRLWVGIVDLFGVSWLIMRRFKAADGKEV